MMQRENGSVFVTPTVRVQLKNRLIELGYGKREDLLHAVDTGSFEVLQTLRQTVEDCVLAEEQLRRKKKRMKDLFDQIEADFGRSEKHP